ncbi:MAG: GNAT family N-acetyltransferase [Rhodospirillales bacterium]|nr:GNAT family N-acetyltransferase [Rhodospirillales bacterium]
MAYPIVGHCSCTRENQPILRAYEAGMDSLSLTAGTQDRDHRASSHDTVVIPAGTAETAMGRLEARLACNRDEIRAAQRLRHRVFFADRSGAVGLSSLKRHDEDEFDAVCDHIVVLDHSADRQKPMVVGTYRLLRRDVAEYHGGFYTAREFDITPLLARRTCRLLELGRSCVLPSYRNGRVIALLWQAIWDYARRHEADAMFGCGSFTGTDPDVLAQPLRFLHQNALAPEEWRACAWPQRRVRVACSDDLPDIRTSVRALPPLIKAYLRVGAFIGDGAVCDFDFGTTDVCIVLPVARIEQRYLAHFGPRCDAPAAPAALT